MSEAKKAPRSLKEIQHEYAQILQRAGQCQYQMQVLKNDLSVFNNALKDLNAEAFAIEEANKRAEDEATAKLESVVAPEPSKETA